jgi:hypothetical protein
MSKQIRVGSTVIARLHDSREVEAKIMKIVDYRAEGPYCIWSVRADRSDQFERVKSRLRRLGSLSRRPRTLKSSDSLSPQHFKGFFGVLDGTVFFAFDGTQEPLFERGASFENPAVHK